METCIIERKSLADLYGTLGQARDRFERKLERMARYGYAAIVVEAELSVIRNPNDHLRHPTKMNPKAAILSLLAWTQRYNVHLWPCPGREAGEIVTFRLLERFFRDRGILIDAS
jgi:ERCC4-type nuclease